jgi:methylthioribose-1-phosphate isomerase
MKIENKHYRTIWPDPAAPDQVCVIDQRLLPHRFVIERLTNHKHAYTAIRDMYVRGAGLIGATAGFGMYLAAINAPAHSFEEFMEEAGRELCSARPTARNLQWAVDRVMLGISKEVNLTGKREAAFAIAREIADEDAEFCRRIGQHGVGIIEALHRKKKGQPVNILTHCNAGWLAFVDYGSATAPVYAARDAGIPVHVWVDETRPWNQGARLTAWELQQEGIPNTLICDNSGGHLMQNSMVDLVIVGSDRTTHTGDVANKIGTYLKALAAHDNGIPFYVALPSSTFDWNLDKGLDIPIEQRSEEEVLKVSGKADNGGILQVQIAAPGTRALNHGFDITPGRLVTGLITERGIVAANREAIHNLYPEQDR